MKFGKKVLILFLLIVFHCDVFATATPNVQWASVVVASSGGFTSKKKNVNCFAPNQVLGEPNVTASAEESPCAWTPKNFKHDDFIRVGFANEMYVEQIAVFENLNPGAITKITLYGEGNELLVYSNPNPGILQGQSQVLNVLLDRTEFKVSELQVDVNTANYNDFYQIDAIAVSDRKEPRISTEINLSEDVKLIGQPENLGVNINSPFSELAPVISPDGKILFFTRENHPENTGIQSIWFAEADGQGKFLPAKNIGAPLNTKLHNFAISILPDGNSMLVGNVYNPDGSQSEGFSMTYKNGNTWSFPQKVEVENYYNYARGSYALASSGKVLLLSVERNDGYGRNDLYVSFLQENGTWSMPKNLGPSINTADREDSPFLAADGTTLYFSSAGWPGYGGNDIFMSRRLDDTWTNWSKPVNLGPQINTNKWDAYFTITASGDYAYFVSSNQPTFGGEDIFRVQLPEALRPEKVILISGKVINSKTKEPVEAIIMYEKLSTGESCGLARSNPTTGEFKIALPSKEKYSFRAEAIGFIPVNEHLDLTVVTSYAEYDQDLFLVPIEKGQKVRINNIFFNTGEYVLLPESYPELERFAKTLNANKAIKISLLGHTDNVGSREDNMVLSQRRAEAVKQFLVQQGIEASRISIQGFGYSKPLASNSTPEGRGKNRRVECEILEN